MSFLKKGLLFWSLFLLTFVIYNHIQDLNLIHKGNQIATKLDNAIPFLPIFVWPYVLGVGFQTIVILLKDRIFVKFLVSFLICTTISLIIFYVFPNEYTTRPLIISDSLSHQLLNMVYRLDAPRNTLPSLHVLYAMLISSAFHHDNTQSILRKICVWISCLVIVLSTLFIKQHFVMDVLAAISLTYFVNTLLYPSKD